MAVRKNWPFNSKATAARNVTPAAGGIAAHSKGRPARAAKAPAAAVSRGAIDETALAAHFQRGGTLAEFLKQNPGASYRGRSSAELERIKAIISPGLFATDFLQRDRTRREVAKVDQALLNARRREGRRPAATNPGKYVARSGSGARARIGSPKSDAEALALAQAYADKYTTGLEVVQSTAGGFGHSGAYERRVGSVAPASYAGRTFEKWNAAAPVDSITDRAKRYRAQKNVTGPRKCVMCGRGGKLDVMHLDGDESHGESANLAYGCRSCNVRLAAAFKRAGLGRPANQYNPAAGGVPTFGQYAWAVSQGGPRGHHLDTGGAHDEAGAVIHATPKRKRIEYARLIAEGQRTRRREAREADDRRWNPTTLSGERISLEEMDRRFAQDDADREAAEVHAEWVRRQQSKQLERAGRRNPASAAAAGYEEFHGAPPSEFVKVNERVHYHRHLSAAGELRRLVVAAIDGKATVTLSGFGATCLLAFNEQKNQLFITGGDQSVNLEAFGIDPAEAHELETLGRVTKIDYHTTKEHLGDEGGTALYRHGFRMTNQNGRHVTVRVARYPDLIYRVRDRKLEFSGGSYSIIAEGIDK